MLSSKPLRKRLVLLALGVLLLLVGGAVVFVSCVRKDPERAFALAVPVPTEVGAFGGALYQSLGVSLRAGHEVTRLDNGAIFEALEKDVRAAQSSVHVLLYIWEKGAASDRISSALVERARAGVACRIVVDDLGSPDFGKDVAPALTAAGCEVRIFRPQPASGDALARNHRKIVVVDGRVGFVGGFGMRDDWLGDGVHGEGWRDTNLRFAGPAVAEAQQAFAENWQEAGGALLPPTCFPALLPEPAGSASVGFVGSTISPVLTRAERLHQLVMQAATKRLWITNAYFVPSRALLELIKRKAREGVDVRLLAPGKKSDSKTSFGAQHVEYGSLIEAGVHVWEYQPTMMHSKTLVIDDALAVVGSMNLDPLTLGKLEESAVVVQDPTFTADLAASFEADCVHARPVTKD